MIIRCILLATAACLTVTSTTASARENRVLKCKLSKVRGAPQKTGPALVHGVKKALTPIDLNAVQMTEKWLAKRVLVEGLWAQRTGTDALLVTARLVNCTKKPLVVRARSNFMDVTQMPTEEASAWKTIFLPARATGVYQERSIGTKNVAAYFVELRQD